MLSTQICHANAELAGIVPKLLFPKPYFPENNIMHSSPPFTPINPFRRPSAIDCSLRLRVSILKASLSDSVHPAALAIASLLVAKRFEVEIPAFGKVYPA